MRPYSFFPLLWLLCINSAQAMQPNGCPDFIEPEIAVRQLIVQPGYNDTQDLAALKQMTLDNATMVSSTGHEIPVGLTAASLKLDSRFEIRTMTSPDSVMVCAQISKFVLNFGFDDTVIYLAREIPNPSCIYQTVVEHEINHVRTDQRLVQSYTPILSGLLRKAIGEVGVIRASSAQSAQQMISTSINNYMSQLGQNLSTIRQQEQQKIDTPEEYARLGQSCDGAMARLLRNSASYPE